jgi:hypothetical protein
VVVKKTNRHGYTDVNRLVKTNTVRFEVLEYKWDQVAIERVVHFDNIGSKKSEMNQ